MNVSEALMEYIKTEIIPVVSGGSEMASAIMSGALRASKRRIAANPTVNNLLQTLGVQDDAGNVDNELVTEFLQGMFEGRENISVSYAELIKTMTQKDVTPIAEVINAYTGIDLINDKVTFSPADAEKFMALLKR